MCWRFVDIVFACLRMPGAGNTDACLRLRRVPGIGKPGATLRQHRLLPDVTTIFFAMSRAMTDDRMSVTLFLSHVVLLTSLNPCTRGSSATTSTPATPTRHRPRRFLHSYVDYGFTTLRSRLPRQRHKGLPPAWEPCWLPLQSQLYDASTVTTVVGMSIGSAFGFFSSLTVCVATL